MTSERSGFLKRTFNKTLKTCGSVYFGVAITTILAVAMGWATFIEREMGTPVAQSLIYAANWFYFLIGTLAFNILCSAFVRLPRFIRREKTDSGQTRINVERKLIPFYLAHLGVVLLILGCWATARFGVQARAIIPEGTAVDNAIDVDSRLFELEIGNAERPELEPVKIEIPFSGGPLNWRDLDSAKNWNENVASPVLNEMKDGSFFKDLAKGAAKISQKFAYLAARRARTSYPGTICRLQEDRNADADALRVDVLDYSTHSDFAPVPPLRVELKLKKSNGASGETTTEKKDVELTFPFDASAASDADPLATSRRALRTTLPNGERLAFILADSRAEFNALVEKTLPNPPAATDAESANGSAQSVVSERFVSNDCVVLFVDSVGRFQIPINELTSLSRSGSPKEQREALETQRREIERRLKLERERTDVPADAANGENGESTENAKPLQTVSREQLAKVGEELRESSEKLATLAAGPNPSKVDSDAARKEFGERRVLHYLATTWSQLESATPTSKEFCETLEKMAAQTTERLAEATRLEEKTRLGDSGWQIVGFEISPTLVPGIDELQGWTARLQLESDKGDSMEATLFSELSERNRYPENGRLFGSLWVGGGTDSETEFGRKWSDSLDKPKLELIQAPGGAFAFRYNDGTNAIQTGRLDETLVSLAGNDGVFAFAPGAAISLTNSQNASDVETIESFAVRQIAVQDEFGARLVPAPFNKETANEFYGKAKVRVVFGGRTETFVLRTIPLESATPEQVKYLSKTFATVPRFGKMIACQTTERLLPYPKARWTPTLKIRLVDRETPLGASLFLKKFTPTYEPGSSTAASFSSLVRALKPGLSPEEQAKIVAENPKNDLFIQMNRPGVLSAPGSGRKYWAYQDSFRGPFKPGDREFDEIVAGKLLPGESTPRETLYYSIVTLNSDPGRGLKYFASLLIVWGTALLVYRKKKNAATKSAPEENDENKLQNEQNKELNKPMKSTTIAGLLLAAFFFSASFSAASAQETASRPNVEKNDVEINNVRKDALDWTAWRLLPVFDGGRRQPLNTFAEILVRDVCGTNAPTIVVPSETIAQLEGDKPLNFPNLEDFLNDVDASEKEKQTAWYREVSATVVKRQKKIAARLRAAFPNGVRRFGAAELLFSWIVEPEIWEYVPFVADDQGTVAREILKRAPFAAAKRAGRLAPQDFETEDVTTKQSLVDGFKATAKTENETQTLKALDAVEKRLASFRSVSFIPTQTPSSRPVYYLNQILYSDVPAAMSGFHAAKPSLISRLDATSRSLERLISSEDAELKKSSPFLNKEFLLRKTTPLSDKTARSNADETLLLARQINLLARVCGDYPLPTTGRLFEELYVSTSDALAELRRHRDEIFAAETFSTEYRQTLQRAVGELSEVVDKIESAYLSLTVEPPKTLAVVPFVRRRDFRSTESQDSPWVPLQTLLWAPDSFYVRFVEPALAPNALNLRDAPPIDANVAKKLGPEKSLTRDELTISPFATFDEALQKTLASSRARRDASNAFFDAATAYRDADAPDRIARFNDGIRRFSDALRVLSSESEPLRAALAAEENPDARSRAEFLAKTAYPAPDALDAEFFYYRLNPFYWNWVACLFAVVAFAFSYLRQGVKALLRKKRVGLNSADQGVAKETEEKFFFSFGAFFLAASVCVALWGGAIRAYITGWAPVTNMFETVVLLALFIAAIAIGFAFYPIWGEPFANAWRSSAFPPFLRDAQQSEKRISKILFLPRVALIFVCVVATAKICYSEQVFDGGLVRTILDSFAMQGILDRIAVLATFALIAWGVPRFVCSIFATLFFAKSIFPNGESGVAYWRVRYSEVVRRKAFLTASAFVALLVAASAYFNSSEFNPNIRPLVAVLRSNFWLTIHVFAIIVSYALGSIAWVVAITSLTYYIFGSYVVGDRVENDAKKSGANVRSAKRRSKNRRADAVLRETSNAAGEMSRRSISNENASADVDDWEPEYCRRVAPIIATMVRSAVLFLTIGIILGARWADFSWGRFWSWDPKEVWALVTLLIYLVVLHALKSRNGKRFGLTVGAVLGALAIVTTWYGLSFVMGGGGRHAYAAGESNKVAVLYLAFALNIAWALLATGRYWFEKWRKTFNR